MLNNLSEKLSHVVKTMRGQARITEENTREMTREIRLALLEADVALPVVREVVSQIKSRALGEEVVGKLNPGQALVGVFHDELVRVVTGNVPEKDRKLNLATQPPAVILLAGLQGAGKTTTAAKLAHYLLAEKKRKVLTVSCDTYRAAAIEQLKTVTEQAGADFYPSDASLKPEIIAKEALDFARTRFYDVLIVDTAGRLNVDEAMMDEVGRLSTIVKPVETFFVADAMLGQTAVDAALAFNEKLALTGVILTKLDGDARGGAALSVTYRIGKPVKFVGVSEKIDGLEPFDAEAVVNRILGMGDIVGLVRDVKKAVDEKSSKELADKVKKGGKFTLDDFKNQLEQMNKIGSFQDMLEKLPGGFAQAAKDLDEDKARKQLARTSGIINAMTPYERRHPEVLKASRKQRVALGSGVPVQEVNRLLKQFEQMQSMMKMMQSGGMGKLMRAFGSKFPGMGGLGGMGGGFPPGGFPR